MSFSGLGSKEPGAKQPGIFVLVLLFLFFLLALFPKNIFVTFTNNPQEKEKKLNEKKPPGLAPLLEERIRKKGLEKRREASIKRKVIKEKRKNASNPPKKEGVKVVIINGNSGSQVSGARIVVRRALDSYFKADAWKLSIEKRILFEILNRKLIFKTDKSGVAYIPYKYVGSTLDVECGNWYGVEPLLPIDGKVVVNVERKRSVTVIVRDKSGTKVKNVPVLLEWSGLGVQKKRSDSNGIIEFLEPNRVVDFLLSFFWHKKEKKTWRDGVFRVRFAFPSRNSKIKEINLRENIQKQIYLELPATGIVKVILTCDPRCGVFPMFVSLFDSEGKNGNDFCDAAKNGIITEKKVVIFPFVELGLNLEVVASQLGPFNWNGENMWRKKFKGPFVKSGFCEVMLPVKNPYSSIKVHVFDKIGNPLALKPIFYIIEQKGEKIGGGKCYSSEEGIINVWVPKAAQVGVPCRIKIFQVTRVDPEVGNICFGRSGEFSFLPSMVEQGGGIFFIFLKEEKFLIKGKVFDKYGKPVAGARIYLRDGQGAIGGGPILEEVISGSSGEFVFFPTILKGSENLSRIYLVYAERDKKERSENLMVYKGEENVRIYLSE